MKRTLLALGLAAIGSSSFAYNAQVDGGFSYFDHDDDWTDTHNQTDVKGTFYFQNVQEKTGPLNEAAFLGHNSNVYAKYSYNYWESENYLAEEFITGTIGDAKDEQKNHNLGVGVEYFVEQFYLAGEVGYGNYEYKEKFNAPGLSFTNKYEDDVTTYRALVGFMPVSNLLLAAGIDGYQGDENDDNSLAVKAKYVTSVGKAGQYVNLEADGTFGDVDNLTIGGDFYFDKAFSLGLAYNIVDDGDEDTDFFSVRTKYFVNNNLAFGGSVGFGDDIQAFNVNATYRF